MKIFLEFSGRIGSFLTAAIAAILIAWMCACSGQTPRLRELHKAAVMTLAQGEYEKSLDLFGQMLKLNPDDGLSARIYNFMGVAFWKLGDNNIAREMFEKSRELNPLFAPPLYNLGLAAYRKGDLAEAALLMSRAAINDTRDIRSRDLLARIYREQDKLDEAERVLLESLRIAPNSAMTLTSLGLVELKKDNIDRAIDLMQQALNKDRFYSPAVFNLGMIYMRRKKEPVQALKYFEDYLENPGSEGHERAVRAIVKQLKVMIATSAPGEVPGVKSSDIAAVKVSFDDLLAEARGMAKAGQEDASVNMFLQAVDMAQRSGDRQKQKNAVREAIETHPDNARPYHAMAVLLRKQDDTKNALEHSKKAATLNPDWFDAQMMLARLALAEGETDVVLIALQQAVHIRPDSPAALWMLAEFYDRTLNLPRRAVHFYSQFQTLFPADSRAIQAGERLARLRADSR